MAARTSQQCLLIKFVCVILLLQCEGIQGSEDSKVPQNGIRGMKHAKEKRGNLKDGTVFEAIDDHSIISMDEDTDMYIHHKANRRLGSQDDIHLDVLYNNHPHEAHRYLKKREDEDESIFSSNSTSITAANSGSYYQTTTFTPSTSPTATNTEPIRIVYEMSELESLLSHQGAIESIKQNVLPEITEVWSNILSVTPAIENIPVPSDVCDGLFPNVPQEVLQNGVPNADLVIFVSGNNVSNGKQLCGNSSGSKSLAIASFCNLDQFDRPIIGFINFCLENFSNREVGKLKKVAVHETAHVLGWNDDLFKYFRDRETGEPLTPRPFTSQKAKCVDGTSREYLMPAENTLVRKKEWISGSQRFYYEIVTPRVKQASRNQFGCQELEGARLENQPTKNSCIGAHFDERYFFTEIMGPILSSKTVEVLSPLTLAVMEDSGFYDVYYDSPHVENSAFGLGAGCDFVTDSCVDETSEKVLDPFKPYFCDTVTKFRDGTIDHSADSTCDPSFTNIAYCDLIDFSNGAPSGYNSPDDNAISYFSDTNLGVAFTRADYCPVPAILSINCIDGPDSSYQKLYPGEKYGKTSKCFNTKFSHPSEGLVNRGACLRTTCNKEDHNLVVHVDGHSLVCEFDGQIHNFPWTQSASFECPPLRSVCPELFCPGLCSAKGVCNYDADPPTCECFDEDDTSAGCYGKKYRVSENEKSNDKDPSSASANRARLTTMVIIIFHAYSMYA